MKKLLVGITDEMYDALRERAHEQHTTMAALVRAALEAGGYAHEIDEADVDVE